ncbi:MAG: alanine racemase, partial [Acidimicrobiales bacterium]
AWAEVDLSAITHNARLLAAISAPAALCAVVKADGYGHGAVPVASAALAGGASELAVALVDEGVELREAGIDVPILVLSEPARDAMEDAIAHRLCPTLYSPEGVEAAVAAVRAISGTVPAPVEVKVDTGMHRVGAAPADVARIVAAIVAAPELSYRGLWTHFAVADEVADHFTTEQLRLFEGVLGSLRSAGLPEPARRHAANSAGAIAWPAARLDLVRCGISLYGYSPSFEVAPVLAAEVERAAPGSNGLRPAMSVKARVTMVREYEAGERVSYGRVRPLPVRSLVSTVPLGYADGIWRGYGAAGGEVLIGGRRCELAGTVTMDQILVDCGAGVPVEVGDEVVLLGRQGNEVVTADEWAGRLGTVSYEVVTRIGPRLVRVNKEGVT